MPDLWLYVLYECDVLGVCCCLCVCAQEWRVASLGVVDAGGMLPGILAVL